MNALLIAVVLASGAAKFEGTAAPLDEALKAKVTGVSWKEGCPVPLAGLRLLKLKYWGFDGAVHDGQLLVNEAVVKDLLDIFEELFDAKFPIESMRLIDDFNASDDASMEANNTTSFNCRPITGQSKGFSKHSWGRAIDINPKTNPYVSKSSVEPKSGSAYVDRTKTYQGGITEGGVVFEAFKKRGWAWGGSWKSPKDFQHFEKK